LNDLVDQIVGRVLDQIGLHTDLPNRWLGTG
jgi:3-polyprenyl-4-hydroxybenzoate decarboxylase